MSVTPGELDRRICGVIITTSSVRFFCAALLRNSCPRIGMSPMPGIFCSVEFMLLLSRPAMANVWPSLSSSSVSVRRVESAGIRKPLRTTRVAEVERADFRAHLQLHAIAVDDRREVEADAEFLELHGDRHVRARPLRDGHGKFAAGEEARLLAALRDEVRLGQALEQAARLERLDREPEVVLLAQDEEVQKVTEGELSGRLVHRAAEITVRPSTIRDR